MAGGGRVPRRRITWIRRRRQGSKLGGHAGENSDLVLKPGNRSHGEWIWVRGHPIRLRGRMRVDANGTVYVPDSEDEEPDMEFKAGSVKVADFGGDTVAGDGVDVTTEAGDADGVKVAGDVVFGGEMHPKVVARLNKVLAHIDPTFHDIFVDMMKDMVPAFFDP